MNEKHSHAKIVVVIHVAQKKFNHLTNIKKICIKALVSKFWNHAQWINANYQMNFNKILFFWKFDMSVCIIKPLRKIITNCTNFIQIDIWFSCYIKQLNNWTKNMYTCSWNERKVDATWDPKSKEYNARLFHSVQKYDSWPSQSF